MTEQQSYRRRMEVLDVCEEGETNRASRKHKVLLVRHNEGVEARYSE